MGIPTRLTIQDYFKQRGNVRFQPRHCGKAVVDADSVNTAVPFSKALDKAQVASTGRGSGLSIQDYMQKRIPSHRPTSTSKLSCTAILPSQRDLSPKVIAADNTGAETKKLDNAPQSEMSAHEPHHSQEQRKILASIERAAAQFGLPAALIKAVVKAESNYQVRALSPAGAQGLMQLMPATARELGVTDPFDIDQNIQGGAQYLRNMLDRFNGDMNLALSAYNSGPGTVAKYAGNVPYAETRTYVQRVLRYAQEFSSPSVT